MQKLMDNFLLSISRNRAGVKVKVSCAVMQYGNILSII